MGSCSVEVEEMATLHPFNLKNFFAVTLAKRSWQYSIRVENLDTAFQCMRFAMLSYAHSKNLKTLCLTQNLSLPVVMCFSASDPQLFRWPPIVVLIALLHSMSSQN